MKLIIGIGPLRVNHADISLKPRPNLLDPRAVHAEVGVPHARGRTNVDQPVSQIKQTLDIVHKSKQATAKFNVPIGVFFNNNHRVATCHHGLPEPGLGLREATCPR